MIGWLRQKRFIAAIAQGDTGRVESFLRKYPYLAQAEQKLSALGHIGLRKPKGAWAENLFSICKGQKKRSLTALEIAAETSNADILTLLLAHGADVNKGAPPYGPLHIAVRRCKPDIVKVLLDHRADPNRTGPHGAPLHVALRNGNPDLENVTLLLRNGADANTSMPASGWWPGVMPLHLASKYLNLETAELLLQYGAGVNKTCGRGSTTLYQASQAYVGETDYKASIRKREMLALLEKHGAKANEAEIRSMKAEAERRLKELDPRLGELDCRSGNHDWAIAGHRTYMNRGIAYKGEVLRRCKRCGKEDAV